MPGGRGVPGGPRGRRPRLKRSRPKRNAARVVPYGIRPVRPDDDDDDGPAHSQCPGGAREHFDVTKVHALRASDRRRPACMHGPSRPPSAAGRGVEVRRRGHGAASVLLVHTRRPWSRCPSGRASSARRHGHPASARNEPRHWPLTYGCRALAGPAAAVDSPIADRSGRRLRHPRRGPPAARRQARSCTRRGVSAGRNEKPQGLLFFFFARNGGDNYEF